ncbi:ion transporter [Halovulum dunhuangense]|uniref:Ion transporter n=1 Tax=Halovulum dunhuangense TaxID=1505036 RepID=A0A849L4M1_9RHOB|nr:ion transporter [Halovulum dunhuangense]NNU81306.1 ion transporter [Halovulum dunhuangense]
MRERLHRILDGIDPEWGRRYTLSMHALIVLAVASYVISTLPDLPPATGTALYRFELTVVGIFAADYALRLYAAPRRLGYVFSFWGIVDLLAFLPALLLPGAEMVAARILRLIQLARILKLMRVAHAVDNLVEVLTEIREQLVVFLVMTLFLLILASIGIYHFEHQAQPELFRSVPHAMWWAVATLSTVGYGDIYPVTAGGRIFTGLVLLIGLGVIAVPTALISAALVSKTHKSPLKKETKG